MILIEFPRGGRVMKKDVVKLLADTAARSGISHCDLARKVFGNDDRASIKKVSSRLNSGEGLDLDELPAFVAALQIAPDELLRAMLPGLPDTRSLIVEKRKSDMRVRTLKAQLAATIYSVDLSLVEEITSSGRWTVGMLPYTCGPSRETEVLSSIRLAVTPTRPDIVEPGRLSGPSSLPSSDVSSATGRGFWAASRNPSQNRRSKPTLAMLFIW
ncbi:hypothetical protein [Nocardia asiatica]|uniref:hypothetical protein n=1 Tax=Nocardia asiatica TaxID=209252 RepID=UPI003EE24A06